MEGLPDELVLHIFQFLPVAVVLKRCALVSQRWRQLAQDEALPRPFLLQKLPANLKEALNEQQHFFEVYHYLAPDQPPVLSAPGSEGKLPWKYLYGRRMLWFPVFKLFGKESGRLRPSQRPRFEKLCAIVLSFLLRASASDSGGELLYIRHKHGKCSQPAVCEQLLHLTKTLARVFRTQCLASLSTEDQLWKAFVITLQQLPFSEHRNSRVLVQPTDAVGNSCYGLPYPERETIRWHLSKLRERFTNRRVTVLKPGVPRGFDVVFTNQSAVRSWVGSPVPAIQKGTLCSKPQWQLLQDAWKASDVLLKEGMALLFVDLWRNLHCPQEEVKTVVILLDFGGAAQSQQSTAGPLSEESDLVQYVWRTLANRTVPPPPPTYPSDSDDYDDYDDDDDDDGGDDYDASDVWNGVDDTDEDP
ncbi:Highly acidic protein [Balamuthia mandrillaris]